MVKEFGDFDEALKTINGQIEVFMEGIQHLSDGLHSLSQSLTADLMRAEDRRMVAESCRLREAMNQITREDAPHSSIAKLKRNMDFNVIKPLEGHLANNERLRTELEKRQRRLDEFKCACQQMHECSRRELSETDERFIMARQEYEISKTYFNKQDRQVFEWLHVLELHRDDILDSCMQTLKHLQYEFFAASAHAVSSALPARMAFRPMAEMLPECLEAQVDLEIREAEDDVSDVGNRLGDGFSTRFVERLARDDDAEGLPQQPVDSLSLSSLLAQGFAEGPARRALRLHRNDTQAAMDWLIDGGREEASRPTGGCGVRMPASAKHVRRRRELLEQQRERIRRAAEADRTAPPPTGFGVASVFE
uniref:UBA domain-containing protein n=1 Tax=Alexandrium monilatum TaxID=311494 RepID=A0A7S4VWG3_9DINO